MPAVATIVIPARNASATIKRAVHSAVLQGDYPILLVDDYSSDDTVAEAQQAASTRLQIVQPPRRHTLGLTRQAALNAIQTPFAVWLDADDELLPGRVDRLLDGLVRNEADLAGDSMELFDGPSSRFLRHLTIPGFLKAHHPLARLFERNYLQGPGTLAFRTEFARGIGYDTDLHGAEDVDFILRSVAAGARFCLRDEPGYRLYAYPSSLSRRRQNQLAMYQACLLKHDYASVQHLLEQAGHSPRISVWALLSMAVFRRDFDKAMELLSMAESMMVDRNEVLEPEGPCPMPEAWRVAFFRSSCLLMRESWTESEFWLRIAERIQPTAECENNLGIAIAKQGRLQQGRRYFRKSLERFPDYADASANQASDNPSEITFHPLRRQPTRRDY